MTDTARIRVIFLIAMLVVVAFASMPRSTGDGEVFVPSRIWPAPVVQMTP